MSECMYGYYLYLPDNHEKIVSNHLKNVQACLSTTLAYITDKKGSVLDELKKAGVSLPDYQNDMCDDDEEVLLENIKADLDYVMDEQTNLSGLQDFRDIAASSITVNGQRVLVLFAGGMSYDSPEGDGYQLLKKLAYLGVEEALYKSIPWDKRPKKAKKKK